MKKQNIEIKTTTPAGVFWLPAKFIEKYGDELVTINFKGDEMIIPRLNMRKLK